MNDTLVKSTNIGAILIANERQDQIDKHGRDVKSDLFHNPNGELIVAARALMKDNPVEHDFPESWGVAVCRKMMLKPLTERYVIAGALLAAEIDRRLYIREVIRKPHHPLTPDEAFKIMDNG